MQISVRAREALILPGKECREKQEDLKGLLPIKLRIAERARKLKVDCPLLVVQFSKTVRSAHVYRIDNGKITELWSEIGFLGIMIQIGAIAAP